MTESEKYDGYKWIKVKRATAFYATPCEGEVGAGDPVKVVPEDHHIEETSFMIEEIRKLAKKLDTQSAALQRYRKQEDQRRNYASRQARWDADHVGYQEDDYEDR